LEQVAPYMQVLAHLLGKFREISRFSCVQSDTEKFRENCVIKYELGDQLQGM
jgi:hypothetical protein